MGLNAMGKDTKMPLGRVKIKEEVRASSDAQEERPPDLHCFCVFFEQEARKKSAPAEGMRETLVLLAVRALLRQNCFHLRLYMGLSLFLQTRTNLPPLLLHVAMAIGEVLHGPSANCSSPAQGNRLAESKRCELALGLTRNDIRTAALGIHHV